MRKVCIYGGSFNPIHIGHLILANTVIEKLHLDEIIFVPCHIQPLKSNKDFAEANHRLEMIKLAIQSNPYFTLSDIELKRKGKSYTIDTLKFFKKKYDNLYFVIGADNIKEFHYWKEPDLILKLAKLIVVNRGGFNIQIPKRIRGKEIITCSIPQIEISSSTIREKIKNKQSIKYLVPESVENYIYQHNLYKNLEEK